MRLILLFISVLGFGFCSAQKTTTPLEGKTIGLRVKYNLTDSIPRIIYVEDKEKVSEVQFYVNGKPVDNIMSLNSSNIDSMTIKKGKEALSNEEGEVHIKLKKGYEPNFITLDAFSEQYIAIDNKPYLYMLNGNVIKVDYSSYLIDTKFILKAVVDHVVIENQGIDMYTINLTTRTPKNIEKANTIRIRGTD